jgi:YHS domain-containing protein
MAPAAVLAAADAHDGTVDHVVSECTGCGLAMAGDAANSVTHEGYELHFCSESCKSNFEADIPAGIARLEGAVKQ